jgi:hypothetical protein
VRRLLLVCCLAVLVAACADAPSDGSAATPPARTLPADATLDFTAATVDGGQLDASSLEGRDVVLWFWAPW